MGIEKSGNLTLVIEYMRSGELERKAMETEQQKRIKQKERKQVKNGGRKNTD